MSLTNMSPTCRLKELMHQSLMNLRFEPNLPIKLYYNSGREMVRMVDTYLEEGDDCRAFTICYRFLSLFLEKIPKHREYKSSDVTERTYYRNKCKEIMDLTERIKERLTKKYELEYESLLSYERNKRKKELDQLVGPGASEVINQAVPNGAGGGYISPTGDDSVDRRFQAAREKMNAMYIREEGEEAPSSYDASAPPLPQHQPPPPPHQPPPPPHSNHSSASSTPSHRHLLDFTDEPDHSVPPPIPKHRTVPNIDRSCKPSFQDEVSDFNDGLRTVIVPSTLATQFMRAAAGNTAKNVETCGILCGRLSHNQFTITHVVIPKQKGTPDSCLTEKEEEIIEVQERENLTTLGWIHTHPTQSSFLSSVDLHTHFSYQVMLPEAIAIVCAPKHQDVGTFCLTPAFGMDFISRCTLSGFHPHPKETQIYGPCPHTRVDNTTSVRIVDLR